MTAKHRKSKNNHKHEENFFKNDVVEPEVRPGANSSSVHLALILAVVVGGAVGLWFCFQQHQTLSQLTDSVAGMQVKIMKLQSAHEEFRQSGTKQHLSESLETRLNSLEESYSLTQKQLGLALATAEQLRSSDLPAQVLSLHTEMESRLSEMQRASAPLEQLSQLQTALQAKSEELELLRSQGDGLAALTSDLSRKVEGLTGSLRDAESKLDERAGQATALSSALDAQVVLVQGLKERVEECQAQLEARTHDFAAVRELLESEESKWRQQAGMEEQLRGLRQGLQDQISAAHNLTAGLQARLDDVQKQVTQLAEKSGDPEDRAPPGEPESLDPPAETENRAALADPEDRSPPAETQEQALPAEGDEAAGTEEEQAPPAETEEEPITHDEAHQEVTDGVAPAEDTLAETEGGGLIETEGAESPAEEIPEEAEAPESRQEQKNDDLLGEEEPQEVKQLEEERPAGDEEEHEEVLGTDEGLAEESLGELRAHEEVEEVREQPIAEERHEEEEEEEDEEQDFPAEWESHSREEADEGRELESAI